MGGKRLQTSGDRRAARSRLSVGKLGCFREARAWEWLTEGVKEEEGEDCYENQTWRLLSSS